MNAPSHVQIQDALVRERLFAFLMLVFETLHPGEPPLAGAWYLKAMCYFLERCVSRELQRAMIWLMPRALKSITAAVALPCWILGRDPAAKVMIVTYSDSLSDDHDTARRQILTSGWYRRVFPYTRLATNRKRQVQTSRRGYIIAVSVEGGITGRGANYIILDDCMRGGDQASDVLREKLKQWFANTLSSRLNDKRHDVIISIQQRLHEDDLPAYLLERGFDLLRLPARADRDVEVALGPSQTHLFKRGDLLDPVRFPAEVLERERLSIGDQHFSSQYLQEPVAAEGNLFKMEQFKRYERPIPRWQYDKIFQSWDVAASESPNADRSVCTTWGYAHGRLFLLDIYCARVDFPGLRNAIIARNQAWKPAAIVIEHSSNGIGIVQELKRTSNLPLIPWVVSTGKVERVIAQLGQIEEGRIWLPAELPGLDGLLNELRAFPEGRHDDHVDSLVQIIEFIHWRWSTAEQQYSPTGRPLRSLRGRRQPPLSPLPPDFLTPAYSSRKER